MKVKFEPRDLWIGVYWTRVRTTNLESDFENYRIYVCLVPCFPVIFEVRRKIKPWKRHRNW